MLPIPRWHYIVSQGDCQNTGERVVVFAMLMVLTFLVDPTQQMCCPYRDRNRYEKKSDRMKLTEIDLEKCGKGVTGRQNA
jgi:hypothetical protein